MQTVSSIYLEGMGEMVRRPSRMRLTFHYPSGDIIYTNSDIVKVTEKKTAHLIAGELPSVELEMELMNLDGSFNPNDMSGLHDMIVKGVLVNYEFGYDIPNLAHYGYTESETEHDYGMEENVPYGFMEGYATEWIPGGEVFTSGEISYSKTTTTISAKDYLSFLDEHVLLAYGNRTLAQVAKDVLSLTDYPKEEDGDPKIVTGPELDAFNTAITLSETDDESISAKEHLQTIAHACGVQMYIDRGGYIHLDNDKRGLSAVYSLPLSQQGDEPEHRKEQMPKKVVITLNSEYGDPVEIDLNGGGETMTVENPFIVTTAEGETLSGIVYNHFIKYRNTADIPYRGEPALDILDTITLGTEFGGDVEAIVVGTELEFDGTLSGSLSVRYQLGGNTPEKVQIKGSGNFIYPLGEDEEPSITSFDLLCETTFPTPTYQWSYFTVSNGSWLNIAGATSNTLTVAYNSSYYNNDSSVKFRCVVNGAKGAITHISKIQLQKSETAGYRGAVVATSPANIDVPSPVVGDVVLMDNTSDETATVYGEACVYNGEEWVATEESDALAMTYKDALKLAEDSGKTIYASKIFTDLLVANEGFIDKLYVRNLKVGTGDSEEVEFDCVQLNGTNSYTETPAFAIAGADRTFEMWIKPDTIDSYAGLFIQNTNVDDTSSNNIVGFQGYPGSSNEVTLAIGSGSAYYTTGKVALPTGVWTHLAGVIEGGVSAKIYLNGNLLINETISIYPSTGSLKVIMGRIRDKYLDGMCRDFRIWNTVRTQQQIQDNMLADLVGNESGLIALWKANEMTGTTLTDSVGSNDATATGISWATDIGVIGGTGFKFTAVQDDGTGKSRFDVYYNGERVFEANPQNGKVYFGNSFWYDPADGAIHTPNDKTVIKANGTIEAVDGSFTGDIVANSGVFKGSIDSSAFSSLPSSSGTTDNITLPSDKASQVNTMADYCRTTLTGYKYYACSVSIDSSVEYISYSGSGSDINIRFYNSSSIVVAEMRMTYGTFGMVYTSSYEGSSLTVSVTYGDGDVFKFKALPTSASGLASGQVWRDGTTLKIVI